MERKVSSEQFGELIRAILESKSLTIREAYKITGVHYTTINLMRNGVIPGKHSITRFADKLGIDADPLLVEAGYKQPSDPVEAVRVCLRDQGVLPNEAIEEVVDIVEKIKTKYQK